MLDTGVTLGWRMLVEPHVSRCIHKKIISVDNL
jgi:hypothetical protein